MLRWYFKFQPTDIFCSKNHCTVGEIVSIDLIQFDVLEVSCFKVRLHIFAFEINRKP